MYTMNKIKNIGIQTAKPIRDIAVIDNIKNGLKMRDRVMFVIGINTALRISDIITLKKSDIKDCIELREKKTGKIKEFKLSPSVMALVKKYMSFTDSDWLFPSRKYGGHINRITAYKIIKGVANVLGLDHITPHSMRKTFGYQAFKNQGVPLPYIMAAYNHSSIKTTMRYLGIEQEELNDELYSKMSL